MPHTPGPWTIQYGDAHVLSRLFSPIRQGSHLIISATLHVSSWEAEANYCLVIAAPDLLAAMPSVPHPGGRLVRVIAHYEDGSTQTIDGDVVTAAIVKATEKD